MNMDDVDDDDESFLDADEMEAYDLVDDEGGTPSPRGRSTNLRPGDHVWMWCDAIGGVRYQHHGILVKVEQRLLKTRAAGCDDGTRGAVLHVADFTPPGASTSALPNSVASGSTAGGRLPHWHGVRVTAYRDASEWHRRARPGDDEEEGENDETALRRVRFLLRNPHLLPAYELLESNCEAVAAWCKTGEFRTDQVAGLLDGGKRNALAAAGAAADVAPVLGPLVALPIAAGAGLSWSAMALKRGESERKWRERTRILNEEFEKCSEGRSREGAGCIIS